MTKLTNKQMVSFINAAEGMRSKKLPLKLTFAIRHNAKILTERYPAYEETLHELTKPPLTEENAKLIDELLKEEIEISAKTVPLSVIEQTESAGFDTLTLGEVEGLEFMIEE